MTIQFIHDCMLQICTEGIHKQIITNIQILMNIQYLMIYSILMTIQIWWIFMQISRIFKSNEYPNLMNIQISWIFMQIYYANIQISWILSKSHEYSNIMNIQISWIGYSNLMNIQISCILNNMYWIWHNWPVRQMPQRICTCSTAQLFRALSSRLRGQHFHRVVKLSSFLCVRWLSSQFSFISSITVR